LAIEDGRRHVGLLDRDDELAREPRRLQAPRIEDKDEPLAVTGSSACDVGRDQAPRISERLEDEAKALRSSRASSIATTSNRETISAMHRRSKRSRRGESSDSERHFSVTRPKARRFQVATRRLRSRCRGGIATLRAAATSPAVLLERDVDIRLAGIWAELARFDELTLEVAAALIRAADSRGYCDVLAEDNPESSAALMRPSSESGGQDEPRRGAAHRLTLSCRRSGMGASGS
jgi:hypothetical protein